MKPPKNSPTEAHNTHHAKQRRMRREIHRAKTDGNAGEKQHGPANPTKLYLYGLHTVRAALANPERVKTALYLTANARSRLEVDESSLASVAVYEVHPRELDKLVGGGAVHQGCVLEAEPTPVKSMEEIAGQPIVLVLDQVTDPHNVGAIMRSAVAMGIETLITTSHHSPQETGVLAKSASGALDMIVHVTVRNLAETLEELSANGYQTVGLDSEGEAPLSSSITGKKVALVLGAEGGGLRQKTRATCETLARVDLPGAIKSLNVSNAAVLSLYIVREAMASSE
jgi:23S rRNA (guanosine2251-2'-O)-methyltransferase